MILLATPPDPDNAELSYFDFLPGVRDLLLESTDRYEVLRVLAEVSRYVTDRLGQPLDFPALLVEREKLVEEIPVQVVEQVAHGVFASSCGWKLK